MKDCKIDEPFKLIKLESFLLLKNHTYSNELTGTPLTTIQYVSLVKTAKAKTHRLTATPAAPSDRPTLSHFPFRIASAVAADSLSLTPQEGNPLILPDLFFIYIYLKYIYIYIYVCICIHIYTQHTHTPVHHPPPPLLRLSPPWFPFYPFRLQGNVTTSLEPSDLLWTTEPMRPPKPSTN